MEKERFSKQAKRGIYLLPNLFTTAGLFAGFYAVVAGMQQQYISAAIAIFVAMIADGLDGRVARMTNTQSAFGMEYDSLSDMVTFGVAPALVVYSWALHSLGKIGWLVAFIHTASVALRLARFNTQTAVADKRYFQGLPSPAGAGLIASLVWFGQDSALYGHAFDVLVAVITVAIALSMVSNIRYHSFKEIDFKGRIPFVVVLLVVLCLALVSLDPPKILFLIFLVYAVSGPVITLWGLHKKKQSRRANSSMKKNG